jgi:hypothetical protein
MIPGRGNRYLDLIYDNLDLFVDLGLSLEFHIGFGPNLDLILESMSELIETLSEYYFNWLLQY